jgi:phage terminase Nu1 subunit (DNA packaging protein)
VSPDPVSQADFGAAVGVTQQAVSEMVRAGILREGATGAEWLLAYCARIREQAAGRLGAGGPLDLVQERAALAREQRMGIEIKNATLRGEFASIALLAEVLATASQAVSERFDHLPGRVRKACPDMPPNAVDEVMRVIAESRGEWVRETAELVSTRILTTDDEADDEPITD